MGPVKAIVIGAGNRGHIYSQYGLDFPNRLKVVGVAEPRKFYREGFQKMHEIQNEKVFQSWEEAAAQDKWADCVFVTTQDQMHRDPAVAFANKGYHIYLEKPMATTYKDCCDIVETCKKNNVILTVGHVLRYMPQSQKIKEIIDSGAIGDVVSIQHIEPVGFWHHAHSFVRGNWRNVESSSFFLLTKSCHDVDLIQYWMGKKRCTAISSFGSLYHFKSQKKPKGAASRCMDCSVEESCPYSAKKVYLDRVKMGLRGWPADIITEVVDIENVTDALRSGPYGHCVYDCDNDVMDNQVVNMQYEDGATCSLSVVAFTERICSRNTRIFGTMGELHCDFRRNEVRQFDFLTSREHIHSLQNEVDVAKTSKLTGHGGANFFAMTSFISAVETNDPAKVTTGPDESLMSHYLCFAAEKARVENRVINPATEPNVDL